MVKFQFITYDISQYRKRVYGLRGTLRGIEKAFIPPGGSRIYIYRERASLLYQEKKKKTEKENMTQSKPHNHFQYFINILY